MKCPKCGAENPDYAFFCGRCATDLEQPMSPKEPIREARKEPLPSIYSMLNSRIVTVETNVRDRSRGLFAGFRKLLKRGGTIVFRSESEVVTLVLDADQHVSILRGPPVRISFEFEGPHSAYLEMFPPSGGFGHLPSSVDVKLGGETHISGTTTEMVFRDAGESLLKTLFA